MSQTPMNSTEADSSDDLQGVQRLDDEGASGEADDGGDGGADTGAGPESGLPRGDDVSTGDDGVGGGNESKSSVLEDTLGAGGDPDEVDRGL